MSGKHKIGLRLGVATAATLLLGASGLVISSIAQADPTIGGGDTLPVITAQPANQTVTAGADATFSAAATGTPSPTVQWYFSSNGGASFSTIAGATSDSIKVADTSVTESGDQFRATFSNTAGNTTTRAAVLTVNPPPPAKPAVTTQPQSQTVDVGANATFSAAASGTPAPTVQWSLSTDGGKTFNPIANATSDTLVVTDTTLAESGNEYEAVFTNSQGSAVSAAATLTVVTPPAPVVTTQPQNQTVTVGTNATFSAAASGGPTVQWSVSTDGGKTFNPIANATSDTLVITDTTLAESGNEYEAVFTNMEGSATSNAATLTVEMAPPKPVAPVVTSQPVNQSVVAGQAASFSAAASGTPAPTVQWRVSTNAGKTFSNIAGATSDTLSFTTTTTAESGTLYKAVFTNSSGSAYTKTVELSVSAPVGTAPAVTTQPASQTVTAGDNATFTAAASGTPTPTVQWSVSTDGGKTWTAINGATSTTLTITDTTTTESGNEYEAVFTNTVGTATSNAATLMVSPPAAVKCVPPNGVLSGPINSIPAIGPPVASLLCSLGL
jgi:hypothetical protein